MNIKKQYTQATLSLLPLDEQDILTASPTPDASFDVGSGFITGGDPDIVD